MQVHEYFLRQKECRDMYGKQYLLFENIGSDYLMYQYGNNDFIRYISSLLQIVLLTKYTYSGPVKVVLFNTRHKEDCINKLNENGYSPVFYENGKVIRPEIKEKLP